MCFFITFYGLGLIFFACKMEIAKIISCVAREQQMPSKKGKTYILKAQRQKKKWKNDFRCCCVQCIITLKNKVNLLDLVLFISHKFYWPSPWFPYIDTRIPQSYIYIHYTILLCIYIHLYTMPSDIGTYIQSHLLSFIMMSCFNIAEATPYLQVL